MALHVTIRNNIWTAAGSVDAAVPVVITPVLDALQLRGRVPVVERAALLVSGANTVLQASFQNGGHRYAWGVDGESTVLLRGVGAGNGSSNYLYPQSSDPGIKVIGSGAGLDLVTLVTGGQLQVFLAGRLEPTRPPLAAQAGTTAAILGRGVSGNYWIVSTLTAAGDTSTPFLSVPTGLLPVVDEILPVGLTPVNGAAQTLFSINQAGSVATRLFVSPGDVGTYILRPAGAPGVIDTIPSTLALAWDAAANADTHATIIGHWETAAPSL